MNYNIGFLIIIVLSIILFFFSYKNRNKNKRYICFFEKLLMPFDVIFSQLKLNNSLEIDFVNKNNIVINTQNGKLYGLRVYDFREFDNEFIEQLSVKFKDSNHNFFYQAFLKDGKEYKQYILAYSKDIIDYISIQVESKILTGHELSIVLSKLIYIDIDKEVLDLTNSISNDKKMIVSTNKVYQGYKSKIGDLEDSYTKLKSIDFKGVIWGYYDFNNKRINDYMKIKLKDEYEFDLEKKWAIINFILITKEITKSQINEISEIFNISLVKKTENGSDIVKKTPLKFRDTKWDLLVPLDYVSKQFISNKEEN